MTSTTGTTTTTTTAATSSSSSSNNESFNTSKLPPNGANREVLIGEEEREKYWIQKLKAASDSRLKELVGRTEGTREELEIITAKGFVIEEERIKNTEYGSNAIARPFWLNVLREKITEVSWEEKQAELKADYEKFGESLVSKIECWHCGHEFYVGYRGVKHRRYCSHSYVNDAFIKRRKERKEWIRSSRVCEYCNNKFHGKRTHSKYCCPSHRVLACLTRRSYGIRLF
jgi:hypothetical protein